MMKQASTKRVPTILVLSSAESDHNKAINDQFVRELNARLAETCHLEWQNYANIGLRMGPHKLEAFIVSDGRTLDAFSRVYFKSYFRYHEQAAAIGEVLAERDIPFVGNELHEYIPAYKLSQMARLVRTGLSVPESVYLPRDKYADYFDRLCTELGAPFIFKAIDGSTGNFNYLIRTKAALEEALTANPERHFVAQRFIPNEADLRILIIGGKIRLVIERRRTDPTTHLNNTSKGATARLIPVTELDPGLQKIALRAVQTMKRDIGGVDLMLEKDTQYPYILEVNASPQIGSGAFTAEKLDVYTDYFKELVS
jgi:glutathione synthase/RimK-type ligase-like ATP-grasp enzyme